MIYKKYIKRILDIVCALLALIIFFPLFVVLTISGAVAMKGNPFFVQTRPGYHEKLFKLIKFKSMTDEKDKHGNYLPDEVRLNKYGRFLRSTSLDEFPEAINIIKGDMSVVGPRPLLVEYLDKYNQEQHRRHEVRPGLSGWAQINGRNSISWTEKFKYDVWYVDNLSFTLDAKIVLKTIVKMIKREGISSSTSITVEKFRGEI